MIDLSVARNCIEVMKKYGAYNGQKIGRVDALLNGLLSLLPGIPDYRGGEIVVFREQLTPSDSELNMGEFIGIEQKPTGRITIESPLTQKEIDEQKAKGSLITTTKVMVNVPRGYVEEIRI